MSDETNLIKCGHDARVVILKSRTELALGSDSSKKEIQSRT